MISAPPDTKAAVLLAQGETGGCRPLTHSLQAEVLLKCKYYSFCSCCLQEGILSAQKKQKAPTFVMTRYKNESL